MGKDRVPGGKSASPWRGPFHVPPPNEEGIKHDEGKLPWHLLPFDALEEAVKVLRHGAYKYGDRNWEKGMKWSRLYAAALRHLVAYSFKGRRDPDTGFSHLAHLICCALFLLAYELRGEGKDDLPKSAV